MPVIQRFSRRAFLRHLALAGPAVSLTGSCVFADEPPTEKQRPQLRSHHPTGLLIDPQRMIRERILPRPEAKRLNEHLCVSSRLENVFYLDLGQHAVLIDTGFDHQVHHHLDGLEALGCDLSRIVAILATHSHVDHTAGLNKARERLEVPVVAHSNAIKPISTGDLLQTAAVIPEVKGWEFPFPACPIDHTVEHGDVIRIDDQEIHILHLPGHTPDCLGFVWNGHFFTGDAVFGAGLIGWAHERWLSNYADHADTMLRLLEHKPDVQMFYASHGPGLPYSAAVPEACLVTLKKLLADDGDPCNHTPRSQPRSVDRQPRFLRLPAS